MSYHLAEPFQRLMRYHMLLEEYKKHLTVSHVDYKDTERAIADCKSAVEHSNQIMKQMVGELSVRYVITLFAGQIQGHYGDS